MNTSASLNVDHAEYQQKVNLLKDLYLKVSSKVDHYFCLPVLNGSTWTIYCYFKGNCYELNYDQFKSAVNDVNFDLSPYMK